MFNLVNKLVISFKVEAVPLLVAFLKEHNTDVPSPLNDRPVHEVQNRREGGYLDVGMRALRVELQLPSVSGLGETEYSECEYKVRPEVPWGEDGGFDEAYVDAQSVL